MQTLFLSDPSSMNGEMQFIAPVTMREVVLDSEQETLRDTLRYVYNSKF